MNYHVSDELNIFTSNWASTLLQWCWLKTSSAALIRLIYIQSHMIQITIVLSVSHSSLIGQEQFTVLDSDAAHTKSKFKVSHLIWVQLQMTRPQRHLVGTSHCCASPRSLHLHLHFTLMPLYGSIGACLLANCKRPASVHLIKIKPDSWSLSGEDRLVCHRSLRGFSYFPHRTFVYEQIHWKKSDALIFCWSTFSFDYGTHLTWRCFDKLHNIYFRPELH